MNLTAFALLVYLAIVGSARGIVTQWEPTPDDGSGDSQDQGGTGGDVLSILDQFDPYALPDYNFTLQLEEITLEGSTKGMVATGISGLNLKKLSLKLVDGKVGVDLSLPSLSVVGEYNATGSIDLSGIKLPLEGEGQLNVGFKGLDLQTSIELGISDEGQILLDDFDLVWNMTDIQVQLDGLFGGKNLGVMINNLLKDALARLVLNTYHTEITAEIISLVKEQGGPLLLSFHKDHGKPDPLPLLSVVRDVDDEVQDDKVQNDRVLCKVFPCIPRRHRSAMQEYADGNPEASQMDRNSAETSVDSNQPANGGELQFKPVGEPRFFPHGSLTAEDTDSNELAVNGVQKLLSTFGLSVEDSSLFGIKPVGEPRVFPQGSLTAEDTDSNELAVNGVQKLLSTFGLSVEDSSLFGIKPVGEPRVFPQGSLTAENTDSNELAVNGVQKLLSTFGLSVEDSSLFGIKPVGEPRFFPQGSLASNSDAGEHSGGRVIEQLLPLFGVSAEDIKDSTTGSD